MTLRDLAGKALTAEINRLMDECLAAAVEQGADPDGWEATEFDCDYVTDALGFKPTREQWTDAGYPYMGGKHVGNGKAD